MSKTTFKLQGVDKDSNALQDVQNIISAPDAEVIIMTAYLRRRAVEELYGALSEAGTRCRVFVGIRNGVTSAQALKDLLATGVQVYAVDTGATDIIFHPKIYASYTQREATLICGSTNLTPSGLWRNFEAITLTTYDLTSDDDVAAWSDVLNTTEKILEFGSENVIKITSDSKIDTLLAEGRVVDEDRTAPRNCFGHAEKGEGESVPRILANVKKPNGVPRKAKKSSKTRDTASGTYITRDTRYTEIWRSKPLVRRDLNLPDAKGTNPTGSMLLKKGLYSIDQQTYFRYEAFADCEWTQRKGKPDYFEYADINFRFLVTGIDYGIHRLEVKYDTRTDTPTYEQKQPMASISWGECKQFLAKEALLGKTMTIYRDEESGIRDGSVSTKNSTYVIEIE